MKVNKYATMCNKCKKDVEFDECPDNTPIICPFCNHKGVIRESFWGGFYTIWMKNNEPDQNKR